jgi:YbgC/YbaW family acyl-CoA thioester hydrolase
MPQLVYTRRVEFAETDAAGIVHFSVFFRYMEEAEHAVWRAAGLRIHQPQSDITWPRISASFDFKSPLRFEQEFEVRTGLDAITRSTIRWAHTISRGDTVIGSGTVTVVCVRKLADGGMKSAELPADVISKLRAALSS